jgi:D-threo-aldose 1-dehydrogenase
MEQISLATSGRSTTHLGFGCASLMGATNRRDSLKLLDFACDAGIRHFDVAPMYGYGEAETCLGDFLQRHRGQITITTKYGLLPPKNSNILRLGRSLAGPILKKLPSLKNSLARTTTAITRNVDRPAFTAAEAKASLHRSLAALRTDHIDLWLLHEPSAANLQDDNLLRLLEDLVQEGTIGAFGIGSSRDKIPALIAERPSYCRTLQYEWSVLNAQVLNTERFRIHHNSLAANLRSLHATLLSNKPLCEQWSALTNADLSNPTILAALMFKAALCLNPSSIILFSSKKPQHIHANVQTAKDDTIEASARKLYALIQAGPNPLLTRQ